MKIIKSIAYLLPVMALLVVAGCSTGGPTGSLASEDHQITQLAQEIRALGPEVDPEEADRAAHIAYRYTRQLAQEYQITDPPLIHNTKVNMGLKPRGLCWHWAKDIEARLAQENFRTLDLHRAIANSDNIRLEHSTAIVSRRGDTLYQGILLDPWRKGGILFWSPVLDDPRYKWKPRDEVLARRGIYVPAQEVPQPAS